MVMKYMFDKNNSVLAGLDSKQKKQNLIVTLAVIIFFILSAFTLMNFLYCLSDCIGSIVCASPDVSGRDALRSLPIFLSFFMTLSGLMTAHTFYRNESERILRRKAKKHSGIGAVLGVIIIVYVIVMRINGRYLSLVEGAPSALYPLDSVLYAMLFIAISIILRIYFRHGGAKKFCGPSRPPVQRFGRFIRSFFRTFWLLIGLYGFCGFFYSIFIVDFTNGYLPYIIAMMLVSLVAFLTIAIWELFYNNLNVETRKKATLPLAFISLVVSVITAVVYFLALKGNLDGPSNVGFGLLPIAFSASVNFATLLVVAMPIIVSVTALFKGLIRRKKAKK